MSTPQPEPEELRPRQALQQRVADAILDAAAQTFAAQGGHANLGDVAHTAGVARATVYRYFPNRQSLVDALTARAAAQAEERLAAARIHEVPTEEGVSRAVRAFVDVGDAFVVLVRERSRTEAGPFEQLVAPALRALLEGGRSGGQIRDDIPPAWLVESLVGIVADVLRHGALARDDAVAAITSVFLDGARASAAPAP
jgi:TetR/AcrR family transcriptional regulator, mexCD-oprJ operon repressor